jgi:hypothetical protein
MMPIIRVYSTQKFNIKISMRFRSSDFKKLPTLDWPNLPVLKPTTGPYLNFASRESRIGKKKSSLLTFVPSFSVYPHFVKAKIESIRTELLKKELIAMTPEEVQVALFSCKIPFDSGVLSQNSVDGSLLAEVVGETDVRDLVGLTAAGDCARLMVVTRSLQEHHKLPEVHNVDVDGNPEFVSQWSVKQVTGWLVRNEELKPAEAVLLRHRIAGDIIMSMEMNVIASMIDLNPRQRLVFKKEIQALRKMIEKEDRDAVPVVQTGCSLLFMFFFL